ncbi:MAG: exopolyphosphatase [Cyclobacteriaceae bacterium]
MPSDKIAVVDLGTNTFHLLISDKNFRTFHKDKVPVMIGKDGISDGLITKEAQQRALNALEGFKQVIDEYGVSSIYATATSAIRNASNGLELLDKIQETTGIEIRVISGADEAGYIYHGVRKALELGPESVLIMDIGGGSVEFIIGNNREILWKSSFEIGAQRLLDQFQQHDPIWPEDLQKMDLFLEKQLEPLTGAMEQFRPETLIGASGTFDTLSEIYCLKANIPRNFGATELPLSLPAYADIHEEILKKNRHKRLKIPGMAPMRVDMIVVASSLIKFILKNYQLSKLRISAYALKEGLLDRSIQQT